DVIARILAAAAEVVTEAGGTVAGGHTIRNPEPVFGLAVQGIVDPRRVFRKAGARPGDVALLSKPVGTGLVTAAGTEQEKKSVIAGMRRTNRAAAAALRLADDAVHAVTDLTGYGLAGHGWEVADRSSVHLTLDTNLLPLYDGARRLAAAGTRTGGDPRNRSYVEGHATLHADDASVALCMDPQTSGGLLAAVDRTAVPALVDAGFTVVGRFDEGPAGITVE
ncbi:MAG: selenide, water dikinase SelD, partial [Actinomycetota bacterium]